jgi:serine phosphatase RsbU (regulator of sigma subunit)
MKRRTKIWLGVGALLGILMLVATTMIGNAELATVLIALFVLWSAVTLSVLLWMLWRWMTYRVSVRLFLSYLLIGVSPFLFCGAFAAVALYILMGQYTSVRFGDLLDRQLAVVRGRCEGLLSTEEMSGTDEALKRLETLEALPIGGFPKLLWIAEFGDRGEHRSSSAAGFPGPEWAGPGVTEGVVRHENRALMMVSVARQDGSGRVTALVPLDSRTAQAIGERYWFQVYFETDAGLDGDDDGVEVGATVGTSGVQVSVDATDAGDAAIWGDEWPAEGEGWWHRPLILWFRLARDVRDLTTGEIRKSPQVVSLLRSSPIKVWDDFVLSRYELSTGLRQALSGMATFFVVLYGIAVLMAGTMIVFITRSTSRLTRAAREVERGNLDHRVKVRRRDQLGDLGLAFNQMIESVQDMLRQVADRERLARELELAREIQESLLPDRHIRHGPFTVHATFRPAAEVGGDYFDIFPLSEDRLVVMVGDVAGHGLHTGLLMASLKSSVAALVHEGYSGLELLERVNRLVIEQGASRSMTTLAMVEIDPLSHRVHITSAGHPPAYLLTPEGSEELLISSLPIGTDMAEPVRKEWSFPASSSLVLYSDGLPEAADDSGEPFGYERLKQVLDECGHLSGGEIAAAVLGALDRHVGDRELADDLTLVVVESGGDADDSST